MVVSAFSIAADAGAGLKNVQRGDIIEVDDMYPFQPGGCSDPHSASFSTSSVNSQRTSFHRHRSHVVGKSLAYPDGRRVTVTDFEEVRFRIDSFVEVIATLSSAVDMLERFSKKRNAYAKFKKKDVSD